MRAGELCAGYGGLALAVEEVFGAETAWFSEFDPAPSKILAHHWPDVPNHGDMTQVDWAAIEKVDIISGGTPCQDLSNAGRRKGMTEGTRSNLWGHMREAIATIQPQYVAWENVRGAYSAKADSDLEQCPRCMGDTGDGRAVLRALGRVLGDLSDLGFDAEWRGLRAADVGACHARFRVFVLAENTNFTVGRERRVSAPGQAQSRRPWTDAGGRNRTLIANPESIGRGEGWTEPARVQGGSDLTVVDGRTYDADGYLHPFGTAIADAMRVRQREQAGEPLAEETWARSSYLPANHHGVRHVQDWGPYGNSIRQWEAQLGRPAPRPTEPTGRNNGERLSPRFTEWMMGLPDGWVTDPAIGISRNEQLKACGNGVVPQQAAAALRDMLAAFKSRELAA